MKSLWGCKYQLCLEGAVKFETSDKKCLPNNSTLKSMFNLGYTLLRNGVSVKPKGI